MSLVVPISEIVDNRLRFPIMSSSTKHGISVLQFVPMSDAPLKSRRGSDDVHTETANELAKLVGLDQAKTQSNMAL